MIAVLYPHRLRLIVLGFAVALLLALPFLTASPAPTAPPDQWSGGPVFNNFNPQTWGGEEPGGGCCYAP